MPELIREDSKFDSELSREGDESCLNQSKYTIQKTRMSVGHRNFRYSVCRLNGSENFHLQELVQNRSIPHTASK